MNFFWNLGRFMMMGAKAHARWEIKTSKIILGDRRRVLILCLLVLPILVGSIAFAAGEDRSGDVLPEVLGGKKAYSPAFFTMGIFLASIFIGLAAGLITGCIGAGGGFVIALFPR